MTARNIDSTGTGIQHRDRTIACPARGNRRSAVGNHRTTLKQKTPVSEKPQVCPVPFFEVDTTLFDSDYSANRAKHDIPQARTQLHYVLNRAESASTSTRTSVP
uniref:Uncharacterized protein n=1 Tax=Mycobacterium leprae TaxID=1769 RepID=O32944_MYCLR|nr:hypothetical protein MLCB2052.32c [Mycobacterium leprae]